MLKLKEIYIQQESCLQKWIQVVVTAVLSMVFSHMWTAMNHMLKSSPYEDGLERLIWHTYINNIYGFYSETVCPFYSPDLVHSCFNNVGIHTQLTIKH